MEKTKLKICHVITRMIVGGAQENTLLTCAGLIQQGHDVTLITGPSPGPEGELLKTRDISGLKVLVNPHLVREVNPYHDFAAYLSLKKTFQDSAFDVVHTHSSKAGIIGRLAANSANVPLIIHTIHGQAFHPYESAWRNKIYKLSERYAAKRCHAIFAVAQAMIEQCVDAKIADRSKYTLIYSGMELEPFLNSKPDCELRRKIGLPEKVPVVGCIARLFPLKGYEFLMPAAKKIAKQIPNTHFLIIGDGIWKEKIANFAKDNNLNFVFTGLVPPSEVCRYTPFMDVLLHLSLREGLPRAVVQALASGKPAVAFNLDGTPEVVLDGKTGWTTATGDVDDVVHKTILLLNDKQKAENMGAEGRNLVSGLFCWKKMAKDIETEYIRLGKLRK